MKPETALGKQLQKFNRIAGVFHLVQGVALFFILNDETRIPVITRFFTDTPEGIRQKATSFSSFR